VHSVCILQARPRLQHRFGYSDTTHGAETSDEMPWQVDRVELLGMHCQEVLDEVHDLSHRLTLSHDTDARKPTNKEPTSKIRLTQEFSSTLLGSFCIAHDIMSNDFLVPADHCEIQQEACFVLVLAFCLTIVQNDKFAILGHVEVVAVI